MEPHRVSSDRPRLACREAMKRFGIGCSAMLLMFGVAVGCTGNSAEPAGSSARALAHSGGFGTRHVTLTCVDANGVSTVVGARAGLTLGMSSSEDLRRS
jgi:hypothetical protein